VSLTVSSYGRHHAHISAATGPVHGGHDHHHDVQRDQMASFLARVADKLVADGLTG
jgi:hypothetical protein